MFHVLCTHFNPLSLNHRYPGIYYVKVESPQIFFQRFEHLIMDNIEIFISYKLINNAWNSACKCIYWTVKVVPMDINQINNGIYIQIASSQILFDIFKPNHAQMIQTCNFCDDQESKMTVTVRWVVIDFFVVAYVNQVSDRSRRELI
jgi:hypothetical protein